MHNVKYQCVGVMTDVIGHISLPVANPSPAQGQPIRNWKSENTGNGKHLRHHLV